MRGREGEGGMESREGRERKRLREERERRGREGRGRERERESEREMGEGRKEFVVKERIVNIYISFVFTDTGSTFGVSLVLMIPLLSTMRVAE